MDYDDDLNDDVQAGAAGAAGEEMEPLEQPKPKPKRVIRKRAKLTLEQLQAPNGLQEVFEKFPKWFQEGYKGKGHEVRDLRRLLELYQRWHPRLFNHCDYNQFESTLEKMSGTNALKVKLQDMRTKLADIVDPKPPEQEQQGDAGDARQQEQQPDQQQQAGSSQPPQQQQQGGGGGFDDIDDDELMEMQAEPMIQLQDELMDEVMGDWAPPAAPQPPAAPAATAASPPPVLQQQHPSSSGPMHSPPAPGDEEDAAAAPRTAAAKRTMRDWSDDDDDDDDDLLQGMPGRQAGQHQAQQRDTQPGSNSAGGTPAPADSLEGDAADAGEAAAAAGSSPQPAALSPAADQQQQQGSLKGIATASSQGEDLEAQQPVGGGAAGEGMAEQLDDEEGVAGLQLRVGTEYEGGGGTRRVFVISDDSDGDD